jgi:hypothetical protein
MAASLIQDRSFLASELSQRYALDVKFDVVSSSPQAEYLAGLAFRETLPPTVENL